MKNQNQIFFGVKSFVIWNLLICFFVTDVYGKTCDLSNNTSKYCINSSNIKDLQSAWTYHVGDLNVIETKPILANNVLVTASRNGFLIGLNPGSGKVLWKKQLGNEIAKRGLVYSKGVIYCPTSMGVLAINPIDGEVLKGQAFGGRYGSSMSFLAPIVDKNFLITANYDSIESFNIRSGKLNWKAFFRKDGVSARLWSGVNYDKKSGLIYVVTSNPDNNQQDHDIKDGGYANSLIALDVSTGKVEWQVQETRHDLWDLDVVGTPILLDIKLNEKVIPAVAAVTKSGNVLLVNRLTGRLVFDAQYKNFSYAAGSYGVASQLDVKKPEPFSTLNFDFEHDITSLSQRKNDYVHYKLRHARQGLKPVEVGSDVVYFGLHGGANWPGAGIEKTTNTLFIPSNRYPWIVRAQFYDVDEKNTIKKMSSNQIYFNKCLMCHGSNLRGFHQSEIDGDAYFPSLIGVTKFRNKDELVSLEKFRLDHKFIPTSDKVLFNKNSAINLDYLKIINSVNADDLKNLYALLFSNDNELVRNGRLGTESFWQLLLDEDGLPGSNPPWGYITAVDLNNGKIKWKKPFGETIQNGREILGDMNFGGVNAELPGIVVASGTRDSYATFLNSLNGELIHRIKLPYPGSSPPFVYRYQGCQYILFTATGTLFGNYRRSYGDALVALKLKDCV